MKQEEEDIEVDQEAQLEKQLDKHFKYSVKDAELFTTTKMDLKELEENRIKNFRERLQNSKFPILSIDHSKIPERLAIYQNREIQLT